MNQILTGRSGGGTHILGGVKELDEEMDGSYGDEKIIEGSDRDDSLEPLNLNLTVSANPGLLASQAGVKAGDGERQSSMSLSLKTEKQMLVNLQSRMQAQNP